LGCHRDQFWAHSCFFIYINDLPSASSFYIRLFADDTFLCAQNENISLLESETNAELTKVYEWLLSNKLTLNISKSKYMLITNKKSVGNISIQINGQQLEQCQSYKYLGVYIDKNLSWKTHVEYVGKKLSRACGALAKTRHYVSVEVLKSIYYALLNSYIRYGIIAWGNASYDTLKPLRTLTNRAVRIMSFAPFGRLDTKPIFKHFNILDIDNTFLLESGKFIYKLKNNLIPSRVINSLFTTNINNQIRYSLRLRSRAHTLSVVPHELLSLNAQKSLKNRADDLWNAIPSDIRNTDSLAAFKRQYKLFLLLDEP